MSDAIIRDVTGNVFLLLLINLLSVGIHCEEAIHINGTDVVINAVRGILTNGQTATEENQQVWRDVWKTKQFDVKSAAICSICEYTVDEVLKLRKTSNNEFFYDRVFELCALVTNLENAACKHKFFLEMDTLVFMMDNSNYITGERVCSIFFQEFECLDTKRKPWSVNIQKPTPHPQVSSPAPALPKLGKIVHMTDINYDPNYKPGSLTKFQDKVCCQQSDGMASNRSDGAGYWGDFRRCDMPWHSVVNLAKHINTTHRDIDYVYFTGDLIGHKAAEYAEEHVDSLWMFNRLLNDTFPGKNVYPILGDQEPDPMNFYSPLNDTVDTVLSTQWLFDIVAVQWSQWLPASATETIRKGGYYTALIKPGFRVIALNSNVCNTVNLWLFYEDKDPYGQLQWLADTLQKAEDSNESVHILSHIPPGDINCLDNWNEVYLQIVTRYAKTIKAQFNGHTHSDDFRLIYDSDDSGVLGVTFNGGSFSSYDGVDPIYKVYEINQNDFEVANYDVWTFNMSKANALDNLGPEWFKLYSFKDTHGVPSMSLPELGKLVKRMASNRTMLENYVRLQLRLRHPLPKAICDDACLAAELCAITAVHFEQLLACRNAYMETSGEKYFI